MQVEPFSWAAFKQILADAQASQYRFLDYSQTREDQLPDPRCILLRHDIDYDPAFAAPISDLEHRAGIQATYFWQVHSPYYRIDAQETRDAIRHVLNRGHRLGLHFNANLFEPDDRVVEEVERAACRIEREWTHDIAAVSFHMPGRKPVSHLSLKNGRVNTYASHLQTGFEYVSDSNQNWRGKDIHSILRHVRPERIQLLIHPIWWQERYTPFYSLLQQLGRKLGVPVTEIVTPEQLALLNESRSDPS